MEKFEGKKEAFVPEERRAEFETAATEGQSLFEKSEGLTEEAKHRKKMAIAAGAFTATAGGIAAVSAGFSERPIMGAVVGAGAAVLGARDVIREGVKSYHASREAKEMKTESENRYNISRGIVEEGMGNVPPEKVIEIARDEMNADIQSRKEGN